ncbi:MAG: fatty acid-binding protein DegV [Clostridia bacterium]|jgi:DegV family protein with EDD domain|nr:fatty acid-binding protein DegV [Clostridia bacterium]
MTKPVLMTDSCCDLPYAYTQQNDITVIPLTVHLGGEEIKDELGKTGKYKEFYGAILSGQMPTTSQINTYAFKEVFQEYTSKGQEVVYIGFSSALSGCVHSARIAAAELQEETGENLVTVIDTKAASLGLGLLVYYANEFLKQGKTKEFIVNWIEENKLKVNHWFTVEDLNHLYRGGRLSKTAAAIGTLLSIKPIMHINDEGKLVPISKVKGRKKSLHLLLDKIKENITHAEEQVVFISHGNCEEEIIPLVQQIKEELKVKEIITNPLGAAVGAHAGPGTVAFFFLGNNR